MKPQTTLAIAVLLLLAGINLFPAAESEQENFLKTFEAVYPADMGWVIDSTNPYAKPVRILKTTESGISVMLDRALVTETALALSFLINGDFPQNLTSVDLVTDIDAGPLLPYSPDSFEPVLRAKGGGVWPTLRLLNEDPPVALETRTVFLMRYDGYISPSDPIRVRIRIPQISVCWEDATADGVPQEQCYFEDEPLDFDFETDGADLAAQTKTFQLDHTFEIDGKPYEFHRLRFNPMELILFTSPSEEWVEHEDGSSSPAGLLYVDAVTDDGTNIELSSHSGVYPYHGFTQKILDPEVIRSLEQTKTLTLTPCYVPRPPDEENDSYSMPEQGNPAYDCSPERAVTVNIRE